jgi:excisionase family DNA binding protein
MDDILKISTETPLAVDLPEAAGMLSVCVKTLRREIYRGNLKALRIGRVWRIRVPELHAYLKRCENSVQI